MKFKLSRKSQVIDEALLVAATDIFRQQLLMQGKRLGRKTFHLVVIDPGVDRKKTDFNDSVFYYRYFEDADSDVLNDCFEKCRNYYSTPAGFRFDRRDGKGLMFLSGIENGLILCVGGLPPEWNAWYVNHFAGSIRLKIAERKASRN